MNKAKSTFKLSVLDIALIGLMVAIIEVCKVALAWLPNVELTSFWLIIFTLYFGKRVYYVVPAFILIEGAIYGFGLWWLMYLYAWPLLVLITKSFKKSQSALTFALISGIFGLSFGFLCSFPYIFINSNGGDVANGIRATFAWWVAGIPWDLIHGVANFLLMMLLYTPINKAMNKVGNKFNIEQR